MVAVLIANVTFLGWAQPPGGTDPYWQHCTYRMFLVFQLLNGAAFLLSMIAVMVVTFFPLILPRRLQDAASFGSVVLLLAVIALIAAFTFAGLVSGGYFAPEGDCATLRCNEGGVPCGTGVLRFLLQDNFVLLMDRNVAHLNDFGSADNTTVLCYAPMERPFDIASEVYAAAQDGCETCLCGTLNETLLSTVALDPSIGSILNLTSVSASSAIRYDVSPPTVYGTTRPAPDSSVEVNVADIISTQSIRPYSQLQYTCAVSSENDVSHRSLCYTAAYLLDSANPWHGPALSVDVAGNPLTLLTVGQSGGEAFSDSTVNVITILLLMLGLFAYVICLLTAYTCAHRFRYAKLFPSKPCAYAPQD